MIHTQLLVEQLLESIKARNGEVFPVTNPKKTKSKEVYRGTIKRAENQLKYRFNPNGSISGKHGYSESGIHAYSFSGGTKPGTIFFNHSLTQPKSKNRRNGKLTQSELSLDIDSSQINNVSTYRNVSAALRHHIKANKPDVIKFTSDTKTSKLYNFLSKKFGGWDSSIIKGDGTNNYTFTQRKMGEAASQNYLRMYNEFTKTIHKVKKEKHDPKIRKK